MGTTWIFLHLLVLDPIFIVIDYFHYCSQNILCLKKVKSRDMNSFEKHGRG